MKSPECERYPPADVDVELVDGVLCYHGGLIEADSDDVRAGTEETA